MASRVELEIKPQQAVIVIVIMALTVFYLTRNWVMPPYLYEIAPYGAIGIAIMLPWGAPNPPKPVETDKITRYSQLRSKRVAGGEGKPKIKIRKSGPSSPVSKAVVILYILATSTIFSTYVYAADEYYNVSEYNEFHPGIDEVESVASYIRSHTSGGEEIFAWPIYAYAAQRPMLFNISRPFEYFFDTLSISGYPTMSELMDHMDAARTRMVVVDIYMENYILSSNPDLNSYIHHNYVMVRSVGDTKIYARAEFISDFI